MKNHLRIRFAVNLFAACLFAGGLFTAAAQRTPGALEARAENVKMKVAAPDRRELLITIENDGSQFDAAAAKKGRGLANVRARARLIEAGVEWRKRDAGSGMIFTLRKFL